MNLKYMQHDFFNFFAKQNMKNMYSTLANLYNNLKTRVVKIKNVNYCIYQKVQWRNY